jgi:hypothetical protein
LFPLSSVFAPGSPSEIWYFVREHRREVLMNTVDFAIAALIGLIDLNPLLDLIFTPLSWALLFFYN